MLCLSQISYLSSHKTPLLNFEKAIPLSTDCTCRHSYMFRASIWLSLCRSMFWLFFILFVLDSNVAFFCATLLTVLHTVYAIGRVSSGLSSASSGQTFFRSSLWISSVAGNTLNKFLARKCHSFYSLALYQQVLLVIISIYHTSE